jgi:hypothetical protein
MMIQWLTARSRDRTALDIELMRISESGHWCNPTKSRDFPIACGALAGFSEGNGLGSRIFQRIQWFARLPPNPGQPL